MIDTDDSILHEYDKNKNLYIDFLEYFKNTITGIISNELIVLQSIDSRCKERESLNKKIQLKQKYRSIHEITDICGMRIITYFSNDVDKIANIIRKEFKIDELNSIDKRDPDDPTKFGYVSLHYVVSLRNNRTKLPEAKKFKGLKIEIQIRTILQHAWAEIEHDLGYKSEKDIPKKIKRQFSRLASHIELADEEFIRIRDAINLYRTELQDSLMNHIENIFIDIESLSIFLNSDEQYLQTIESFKLFIRVRQHTDIREQNNIFSNIIQICNKLEIKTIKDLKDVYLRYSMDFETCLKIDVNFGMVGIGLITPLISVLMTLNIAHSCNISSSEYINIHKKRKNRGLQ